MIWKKCLSKVADFVFRNCLYFTGSAYADEKVTLDGDVMEKTAEFSYLRDVLSSGRKVQEAVAARIRRGWKKLSKCTV